MSALAAYEAAEWPVSWDKYLCSAYTGGLLVRDKLDAMQAAVDDAAGALEDILLAVDDLNELSGLFAQIAASDRTKYANSTWERLETALSSARDVYGDPDATSAMIKEALNNLKTTLGDLQEVRLGLASGQSSQIKLRVGQVYQIALDTNLGQDELAFSATPVGFLTVDANTGIIKCVKAGGTVILMIKSVDHPNAKPLTLMITTSA